MTCSKCFHNEGMRIEAERLGILNDQLCANCHSRSGYKLNKEKAKELMDRFFRHGSVPQNVGGYAPVYNLTPILEMETAIFQGTIQHDYELLKQNLDLFVYNYSPALWKIGLTDQYFELSDALEEPTLAAQEARATTVLEQIIAEAQEIQLPQATKLYRVRINISEDPNLASSYDTAPDIVRRRPNARYGRFDTYDRPVFYASPDIETCLHECRITAADEVYLATLRTARPLRILNIAVEPSGPLARSIGVTMYKLCGTNEHEYPKCRLVAGAVQRAGYDGFQFQSYYSIVKPETLYNIAVFGHPIANGDLILESVNRVKLERVDYAYSFGPPESESN